MKKKIFLGVLVTPFVLVLGLVALGRAEQTPYNGSSFEQVWSEVKSSTYPLRAESDPASELSPQWLPHYSVSLKNFYSFELPDTSDWLSLNPLRKIPIADLVYAAGQRTLNDEHDLLLPFRKLVHSNGICLAGHWRIDSPSEYTGGFANSTDMLVIARASVALSATTQGNYRAFGLALKLFPTADTNEVVHTANVFTVDDLGGAVDASGNPLPYYTEARLLNEPAFTKFHPSVKSTLNLPIGAAVGIALNAADPKGHVGFRQVYPISWINTDPSQAHTPYHILIEAAAGQDVSRSDFRDELRLENHNGQLNFVVWAQDKGGPWNQLGTIEFTDYAVSSACDRELHFHHPTWIDNLQ